MKAIITGAAGFVGSYLANAVKNQLFCDVIAVIHNSDSQNSDCWDDVVTLDMLDEEMIYMVLSDIRPDYIFHLAAQSSVSRSWEDPAFTIRVNIEGTLNLLNSIRRLDYVPRVLIVGSGDEYGECQTGESVISETTSLNPRSIYAITKVCQNMMSTIYAQAYGLQLVMVRSFNHIGPGQSTTFVVSDFCSQVAKIEAGKQHPIIKCGDLTVKRDFTDVRDVVRAYVKLMQYGRYGETYNVGCGRAVALQDILTIMLSMTSTDIRVEIDPKRIRPADVKVVEPDISKLYNDTGWEPEIPLDKTISDTLEYWRRRVMSTNEERE